MKIGITLTLSMSVGQEYIDITRKVASRLAEKNHSIVYGGTAYGMMFELAEQYKNAGGVELIGVMAKDLMAVTKEYKAYTNLDQKHLMETISERKQKLIDLSDAFLIMPGGYGTIEELIDVIGGKVNKLFDKPIAIYNFNGFYDTLITFLGQLFEKKFSKTQLEKVVFISNNLDDILDYFQNYKGSTIADKFVE